MIIFYFLILVMPLSQHRIWAQFVGELTGIKYLGLACLPYALFRLATRRSIPSFFGTMQARLFFVFYLIVSLSHLSLGLLPWWVSHWLSYTSFVVLYFVTVVLVDTPERLRRVMLVAVGALGLASLYVLRDWQLFHDVYKDYRPGWVVGDPNYFTVSVLLFLPAAVLLMQTSRPKWERLFCFGCLILTLLAVMVSASRGGFLGIAASVLYLILRSGKRFRNLVLVGTSFTLLTLFTPMSPVKRFLEPGHGDNEAVQTRKALWRGGMRMILAHPIMGVGLDNFLFRAGDYVNPEEVPRHERITRVAHNSYVEIAAEMGLPGFLVFLGILAFTCRTLEQVRKRTQKSGPAFLSQIALGLQAGVIGSIVAIFFVSGQYQKMFWLALFLSMALPSLVSEQVAEPNKKPGLTGHPAALPAPVARRPEWTQLGGGQFPRRG